jgi:hypothetical protein
VSTCNDKLGDSKEEDVRVTGTLHVVQCSSLATCLGKHRNTARRAVFHPGVEQNTIFRERQPERNTARRAAFP